MGKLGKERYFDIYEGDEKKRFLLGNEGRRKLFVVGLNPSKADQCKSDKTIDEVQKVLKCKKLDGKEFDGFVMANLYPLRCTNPKDLPKIPDECLIAENFDKVFDFVGKEDSPIFWAAWGGGIEERCYFSYTLEKFVERAAGIGVQWLHFGPLTTKCHPRHASLRGGKYSKEDRAAWDFQSFDVEKYVCSLKRGNRQYGCNKKD